MTTQQAARTLGIGANAILDAIKRGTLRADKIGRSWEIDEAEVERYRREHLGQQGRVSPEQAKERAHRAAQTARERRGRETIERAPTPDTNLEERLMALTRRVVRLEEMLRQVGRIASGE